MANVPGLRLENICNGKKCKLEIKLNIPCTSGNKTYDPVTQTHGNNNFRSEVNASRQYIPSDYDTMPASRDVDEMGSESDSSIESLNPSISPNDNVMKYHDRYLQYKSNKFISQSKIKNKSLQMKVKKNDILMSPTSEMLKDYDKYLKRKESENKRKVPKKIYKLLAMSPSDCAVYPLGSYCEDLKSGGQNQMNDGQRRLGSMYHYKGNGNQPVLARNGFYHDPVEGPNSTKCFACAVKYSQWTLVDDVPRIHREISPRCPFLTIAAQNNINQTPSSLTTNQLQHRYSTAQLAASEVRRYVNNADENLTGIQENQQHSLAGRIKTSYGQDVTDLLRPPADSRHPGSQESSYRLDASMITLNLDTNLGGLDMRRPSRATARVEAFRNASQRDPNQSTCNPKYPNMCSLDARMRSFNCWPHNQTQTPKGLTDAGFFFTGFQDLARCYQCGIGLKDWSTGDDPMVEHVRWSPSCKYIENIKGRDNIANTQRTITLAPEDQRSERSDNVVSNVETRVQEMGYSLDLVRRAVKTIRQETRSHYVSVEQTLSWIFEQEERQSDGAVGGTRSTTVFAPVVPSNQPTHSSGISRGPRLEEHNEILRQVIRCKICQDATTNITFLPCGHSVCCESCVHIVRLCPECKQVITGSV